MSSTYHDVGKRIGDLTVAIPLMIVLSPVLAFLIMLIRWTTGEAAIFHQTRTGRRDQPFTIYKLRTMTNAREGGVLLPDAQRLTTLGRFLRASSLDELPQLWNVIRGEMSLIGPRPLPAIYLDRYSAEQARRHNVRPGITGLAQVEGRNELSWEEKFRLDVWYVDHVSTWLDLQILAKTVLKVVRRSGISAEGQATMTEFNPAAAEISHREAA